MKLKKLIIKSDVLTHDDDNGKHDANDNASRLAATLATGIGINGHLVCWHCWYRGLRGWLRWWQCFWCATLSLNWSTTLVLLSIVFAATTTRQCVELALATFRDAIRIARCPIGLFILARSRGAVQATCLIGAIRACICT